MADDRPTLREALHPSTLGGQIVIGVVVSLVASAITPWLHRALRRALR